MDNQEEPTGKPILLSLADRLVEAQQEIDELTLQLALGKAEIVVKYEEIKMEFRHRLTNFRNSLKRHESASLYKEMISRLDHLEDRLNFDKAENRVMFAAQRKFILKSLRAFEDAVQKVLPHNLDAQYFMNEIENFKLKMEILRLKFELKRFTIRDEIKSNSVEVRKRVTKLIDKARKKIFSSERRFIHLDKDILSGALLDG